MAVALAGLLGVAAVAVYATDVGTRRVVNANTVVDGLTIPWDITWVGDVMLFNERPGRIWSKRGDAAANRVDVPLPHLYVNSEAGLLGMVAHPLAAENRIFFTCQSVADASGDPLDLRVMRWRLTSDIEAVPVGSPIVTGIPLSTGPHSGCRMRFGGDGKLFIATGDTGEGSHPQDLASLGGKVLRVNDDGSVPADNPFTGLGGNARYVWTYGHRNVQGLALRPGTTQLWSAEHGPDRDDEVNVIVRGANYGWHPVGDGYDQTVPMTDLAEFSDARPAMWSSGSPTLATSGAAFLNGAEWGRYEGALAVGLLKSQGILIIRLDPAGNAVETERLPAADNGERIRTVQQGPDGALYYTTSEGGGLDRIVRLEPARSAWPW